MTNNMRLAVIGTGYVGLVSGVCFATLGFKVCCVDKDAEKISKLENLEIPIYEPGVKELVEKNLASGHLSFTSHLMDAIEAEIIFIAVGTPTDPKTGRADLHYVEALALELAPLLTQPKVIVVKSTVPVGTNRYIADLILKKNPAAQFMMASNPEFLREGSAVQDFMNPDRIIIGTAHLEARRCLDKVYHPFRVQGVPILHADIETAEMIKYTANCFLATKLGFVNEIAVLCEKLGADIEQVMIGIGLDKRIGHAYLKAGPGYGGSCFPKDTRALATVAAELQLPLNIVEAVIASNEKQKRRMTDKIIAACCGDVANKSIAILGLAFKANTDDIRDSAAITIIEHLQQAGAHIAVFDPVAMEKAKERLQNVRWGESPYQAIEGSDVVVIVTEWEAFRHLDLSRVKTLLKKSKIPPTLIDLRNMYEPGIVTRCGLRYLSIGRAESLPERTEAYVS